MRRRRQRPRRGDRDVPHRAQAAEPLAQLPSPSGGRAGGGETPGIEAPRPGEEEDAGEVERLGDEHDPLAPVCARARWSIVSIVRAASRSQRMDSRGTPAATSSSASASTSSLGRRSGAGVRWRHPAAAEDRDVAQRVVGRGGRAGPADQVSARSSVPGPRRAAEGDDQIGTTERREGLDTPPPRRPLEREGDGDPRGAQDRGGDDRDAADHARRWGDREEGGHRRGLPPLRS